MADLRGRCGDGPRSSGWRGWIKLQYCSCFALRHCWLLFLSSGLPVGAPAPQLLIGVVLLMPACTNVPPEATAVADQFVRAYFVEDNVAAAAKLTSGAAKSRLDGVLRQIEATGLKEPAKDKPRVKVTPVETQSVSADVIGYVYRRFRTRYSADHRETAAQQERQYLERERIQGELLDRIVRIKGAKCRSGR